MNANLDLVRQAITRLRPNGTRTLLCTSADEAEAVLRDLVTHVLAAQGGSGPAPAAAEAGELAALEETHGRLEELRALLLAKQEALPDMSRTQRRWDIAAQLLYLLVERQMDLSNGRHVSYESAHLIAGNAYTYAKALTDVDENWKRYERDAASIVHEPQPEGA